MKVHVAAILGGICGLLLFFFILSLGVMPVEIDAKEIKAAVAYLIATLLGAWVGGAAAFRGEEKNRQVRDENTQLATINKLLFNVSQMYFIAESLKNNYILKDGKSREEPKAFTIDSPLAGTIDNVRLNFDDLSFLLVCDDDAGEAQLVMDLYFLQSAFQNLLRNIDMRDTARKELELARAHSPSTIVSATNPQAVAYAMQQIFPNEFNRLVVATKRFEDDADSILELAASRYADVHNILGAGKFSEKLLTVRPIKLANENKSAKEKEVRAG